MNPRIYIAGPYTKGDVAENVRRAIFAGEKARALGFTVFVPHLYHFWHFLSPHEYQYWMDLDLEWLRTCHVLLRLEGESSGAEIEIGECVKYGIDVVYSEAEAKEWISDWRARKAAAL